MVYPPKEADSADCTNGMVMALGVLLSVLNPGVGIALILYGGLCGVCVSIERLIPEDSVHRVKRDPLSVEKVR